MAKIEKWQDSYRGRINCLFYSLLIQNLFKLSKIEWARAALESSSNRESFDRISICQEMDGGWWCTVILMSALLLSFLNWDFESWVKRFEQRTARAKLDNNLDSTNIFQFNQVNLFQFNLAYGYGFTFCKQSKKIVEWSIFN